MPFILSGNSVCMSVPSYSILLGIVGCCLGRAISPEEVKIGFQYQFDTVGTDMETRHRLEFDGNKIKPHTKGTDAYKREFHVGPKLTLWLDRLDWESFFLSPIGTPGLGRSQDLLKVESVKQVAVKSVDIAIVAGCMIPFSIDIKVGGQLIQLAEAYQESDKVGGGRVPTKTAMFLAIPHDNPSKIAIPNLFITQEEHPVSFYLHHFS
jgi:CRISPR-associated protein Cas5t